MGNINWVAVSAIGQCVGAFGTLVAVIISLNKQNPKIGLFMAINDYTDEDKNIKEKRLQFIVTNNGHIPVRIQSVGYMAPKSLILANCHDTLPIMLMPAEEVKAWANDSSDIDRLKTNKIKKVDLAFAICNGKLYYQKVNPIRRFIRWYWQKFGKFDYYKRS